MELNLPDGFLKGEVRDGFYVETMMKRNWACMIKVLAEIDRICEKHGIKYFADWGTLLGAVRHKGFIPWDDDIDIGMKREDYNRFCAAAKDELPKGWVLWTTDTEIMWRESYAHVTPVRSVDYSPEHTEEFYGFPYVPGVDIFPYDYIAPLEGEDNMICRLVHIVGATHTSWDTDDSTEEEKIAVAKSIEKICNAKFDYTKDIPNQLIKLQESLSTMIPEKEARHVAIMPLYAGKNRKDRYPKGYFDNLVRIPFEYVQIPVPERYEEILSVRFGENWRTPIIGTQDHEYPYYKKQYQQTWRALGIL